MPTWVDVALPNSIEKRLRSFVRLTDALITIGLFFLILKYKLGLNRYFATFGDAFNVHSWGQFLLDKGGVAALSALVVYNFVSWRSAARRELEIGTELFSRSRTPLDWASLQGAQSIPKMILAFYGLFLALALTTDDIRIFGVLLAFLYVVAFRSQWLRRHNLKNFFADPRFVPSDGDDHKPFIMRRRDVIARYLFGYGHLIKESLVIIGGLVASLIAFLNQASNLEIPATMPFWIVLLTIVLNEVTTWAWRRTRNAELGRIDADQLAADRARISATP